LNIKRLIVKVSIAKISEQIPITTMIHMDTITMATIMTFIMPITRAIMLNILIIMVVMEHNKFKVHTTNIKPIYTNNTLRQL